ncbi:MAG: 1-aminocyclopropane-1-carboxylate deaminase/D-cysteine desulfhydrase [Tropicimonas sp.]|uniref:1-aminocyclopropane-1-carboxylate deaminase/D-cysteine desulfhydrase n=1 Tax=Tropicimonas sp. TaxID=2067044 RepID=UPI003A83D312
MPLVTTDPRFPLLAGPTPLRRLDRLEARLGCGPIYLKRDDFMEIGLGGNKLRSLEFWLGAALAEGADVVLVAGGPMSNLCRLTAAAAGIAGLDCVIFHNVAPGPEHNRTSFPNRIFGAELRFLGDVDEDRRAALVEEAAAALRAQGRRPYIVGDAVTGALGYVEAAGELHAQSRALPAPLRHVFLAGSMGPTEAGFIFGNAMLGHPFEVHLVSVEYGQAELAARIARICGDLAVHTGFAMPDLDAPGLHYHMGQLGPGYARPTPAAEAALLTLARSEGILLEHVYTAKTFAGFLDCVHNGVIPAGEPACMVHTGGTASLFAQFHLFRSFPEVEM